MSEGPPQLDYAGPEESEAARRRDERDGRAVILMFCVFAAVLVVLGVAILLDSLGVTR